MELIQFYFEKDFNRIRLLFTTAYLICVVLITKTIVGWLGLHYTFPKEISLAQMINFVMSGQVFIPVLIFTLYLVFSSMISSFAYRSCLGFAKKTILSGTSDTGMSVKIRKELIDKGFVREGPNRYVKGPNYREFTKHMDILFNDQFNLGSLVRLSATVFFNFTLVLVLYQPKSPMIWVFMTISFLLFIGCFLFTLAYLRLYEYRPFYQMFLNHVSDPEQYPQMPVGYSTAAHKR